jgi:hypothetical protein
MRCASSIAVLTTAVAVLTGCGGAAPSERADTLPAPPSTGGTPAGAKAGSGGAGVITLSQPQVDRAMLTVADMPTGFATDTRKEVAGPSGCPSLDAMKTTKGDTSAEAEADFSKGSLGPFVNERVWVQPDGKAERNYGRFADAIKTCSTFVSKDDRGKPMQFKLAALSFPNLGDETFAARMITESEIGALYIDLIIVRLDDTMVSLINAGFGGPDSALTEQIARKGVDKVKSVA